MAKSDLPVEVDNRRLSYVELLSTLEMVDGEQVVVMLSALDCRTPTTEDATVRSPHTAVSLVGEIHRSPPRHLGTNEFVIGTPFEDLYPDRLAGGVLYLSEDDFKEGALTTYDGNDFFNIAISTTGFKIFIQDQGGGSP
jgi:hypothetical protein